MAITKDAKVTVGVEGAEQVGQAAEKALSPWRQAGQSVAAGFKSVGGAIRSELGTVAREAQSVAFSLNKISLGDAAASSRALTGEVQRLATVSGKSFGDVEKHIGAVSRGTLQSEDAVIRWQRTVGRVAGSYEEAGKAAQAVGNEALALGRNIGDMPLAENLLAAGVAGDKVGTVLGTVRAQAEKLGTVGGAETLQDQIAGLGQSLQMVNLETDAARDKFTALMGVLGKGLGKEQGARVQSTVMGALSSNAIDISRTVGYDILDKQGRLRNDDKVDPTKVLADLKARMARSGFSQEKQLQAFRRFLGNEAGSAAFYANLDEVKAVAGVGESSTGTMAAAAYKNSQAGKNTAAEQEAARRKRALGEPLSDVQTFFGEHPILGLVADAGLKYGAPALAGAAGKAGVGTVLKAGANAGLRAAGYGVETLAPAAAPLSLAGVAVGQMYAVSQLKVDPEEYKRQAIKGGYGAYAGNAGAEREGRVRALVRAAERSGGDNDAFIAEAGKPLLAQAEYDPNLRAVAQGLVSGEADAAALGPLKQAFVDALRETGLNVTVVNQSSGPVQVVQGDLATGKGRN